MKSTSKLARPLDQTLDDSELKQIWDLSLIHTPDIELAHFLGFNFKRWFTYKAQHPELQDLINRARAEGAANLRRAQWISALKGNTQMQIWLGRELLNQNRELIGDSMPTQLGDIDEETRQRLITLRDAIYQPKTVDVQAETEPIN